MDPNDKTIRIVLIGGSGYAGFEALRWLARHPVGEVIGVFGPETELGRMDAFYPLLADVCPLEQQLFDMDAVVELEPDLAMLCVPHKVAMSFVPHLRQAGIRVIDWSADYRLPSAETYEQWYCPHTDADRLAEAVYGLPEFFADDIRPAGLVANPGCYPTAATLALAPVLQSGLIESAGIVVNAVTGVSGAGRGLNLKFHFPEQNENLFPYGIGAHRHMPEIEQTLSTIVDGPVEVLFQPHVAPMDRGILESIYARPTGAVTREKLLEVLHAAYEHQPFVRVRDDVAPATKYVSHTNFCDVTAHVAKGCVVLFSAIDNLIKGASGQAIQNMNLMFSLDERTGLL